MSAGSWQESTFGFYTKCHDISVLSLFFLWALVLSSSFIAERHCITAKLFMVCESVVWVHWKAPCSLRAQTQGGRTAFAHLQARAGACQLPAVFCVPNCTGCVCVWPSGHVFFSRNACMQLVQLKLLNIISDSAAALSDAAELTSAPILGY